MAENDGSSGDKKPWSLGAPGDAKADAAAGQKATKAPLNPTASGADAANPKGTDQAGAKPWRPAPSVAQEERTAAEQSRFARAGANFGASFKTTKATPEDNAPQKSGLPDYLKFADSDIPEGADTSLLDTPIGGAPPKKEATTEGDASASVAPIAAAESMAQRGKVQDNAKKGGAPAPDADAPFVPKAPPKAKVKEFANTDPAALHKAAQEAFAAAQKAADAVRETQAADEKTPTPPEPRKSTVKTPQIRLTDTVTIAEGAGKDAAHPAETVKAAQENTEHPAAERTPEPPTQTPAPEVKAQKASKAAPQPTPPDQAARPENAAQVESTTPQGTSTLAKPAASFSAPLSARAPAEKDVSDAKPSKNAGDVPQEAPEIVSSVQMLEEVLEVTDPTDAQTVLKMAAKAAEEASGTPEDKLQDAFVLSAAPAKDRAQKSGPSDDDFKHPPQPDSSPKLDMPLTAAVPPLPQKPKPPALEDDPIVHPVKASGGGWFMVFLGTVLSVVWVALVIYQVVKVQGMPYMATLAPHEWGTLLTGALAPVVLLWVLSMRMGGGRRSREMDEIRAAIAQINHPIKVLKYDMDTAADNLTAQALQAEQAARKAVSAADAVRRDLNTESGRLAEISNRIEADNIMIKDTLEKQCQIVQSTTDATKTATQQLSETLLARTKLAEQTAKSTEASVHGLLTKLESEREALQQTARSAQAGAREAEDRLQEMTKTLNTAGENAEGTVEKLEEKIKSSMYTLLTSAKEIGGEIQALSDTMEERAKGVKGVFEDQDAWLSAAQDKIASQSESVHAGLKNQAKQLDTVLDRVLARVKMVEEGLSVQTGSLNAASEETIQRLNDMHQAISEKSDALLSMASKAEDRLEGAASRFGQQTRSIADEVQKVVAEVTDAEISLGKSLKDLDDGLGHMKHTAEDTLAAVKQHTDDLVAQGTIAAEQGMHIRSSLNTQTQDLADTANAVATQVRVSEAALDQQSKQLRSSADYITDGVNGMVETMRMAAKDLMGAADDVFGKVRESTDDMSRTFEKVNDVAKAATEGADLAQSRIKDNLHQLGNAAENTVADLNKASETLEVRLQTMANNAADIRAKTTQADASIRNSIDKLMQRIQQAEDKLGHLSTAFEDRVMRFENASKVTKSHLDGFEQGLHDAGSLFAEAVRTSVDNVDHVVDKMRHGVDALAGTSRNTLQDVRQAADDYRRLARDLQGDAKKSIETITEAAQLLGSHSQAVLDVSDHLQDKAGVLSKLFYEELKSLRGAAEEARAQSKALEQMVESVDTMRFLSNAAAVVERLQSLTVDITRMFTPNVEEELWKRYHKGDSDVFVRHMAKALSKEQVASMRKALEVDPVFRDAVVKYVNEYEALLDLAKGAHRADTLTAIFTSADVGKLYLVLSRALGRIE
jgi:uncharacterized phage infection (PIP) family protein YhgE